MLGRRLRALGCKTNERPVCVVRGESQTSNSQMNNLHIYTARFQPATKYTDNCAGETFVFTNPPKKLFYVECCRRFRRAENCVVQAYYDHTSFWCAPGKGCKSKREIKAKRNKEFRNRSAGAKAGWLIRKQKALAGKSYPV